METAIQLIRLSPAEFAAVVALFLPGFVSLKIDRLIHPDRELSSVDTLIEIIGYSLLNAGVFSWAIAWAATELAKDSPALWLLGLATAMICLVGPVIWPLLLRWLQKIGSRQGWLLGAYRFAWDDYFSRRDPCWVIVHLKNGQLIGGYFGEWSYASRGAESGHLYLEELWDIDVTGKFVGKIADSKGALFRPTDYDWIEFFEDDND